MFDPNPMLAELNDALDAFEDVEWSFGSAREAAAVLRQLEAATRRVHAVKLAALDEIDRSGIHFDDGHASAKVMMRHCGRRSPGAAAACERGVRMSRELPQVFAALRHGTLGVDQFDLLGRVWANPRVRAAMVDAQARFLRLAARLSFRDFELEVRSWERYADEDGAEPANSRNHELRSFRIVQDPVDLGWEMRGGTGAMQGAQIDEIFAHYVSAERLADWEKARAEYGDGANLSHLPRTEAQRQADALWQVFHDAAANPASACPAIVHNVVWNQGKQKGFAVWRDPEGVWHTYRPDGSEI